MKATTLVRLISGLLLVTVLVACGGPPEYLDERYARSGGTLAIIAPSPIDYILPANRSNLEKPGGGGGGWLGAFANSLADWEYNKAKSDLYLNLFSLEEDRKGAVEIMKDPLRFDYATTFDTTFLREFSVPFTLITDSSGRFFDPFDTTRSAVEDETFMQYYQRVAASVGADLVLAVYYAPRLALFSGRISPTPMIRAQVDVIDPNEGKLLMSTIIHTDRERRRIRSAEDLAADSCALYRKEYVECVRVLARQIAERLGTELPMKQHSHWATQTHLR